MTPPVEAKPREVSGHARQLDVLARQLLAARSGLEAATAQLDAAFAVLSVLQIAEDMRAAGPTVETPDTVEDERPRPAVFGARRREAAAAAAALAGSPVHSEGSTDG